MTTRRSFIAVGAAASVAASIPIASASAAVVDRTEWERAFAAMARIRAEDDAFTPNWLALSQKCKSACEAIPHVTLRPDPHTHRSDPVSTADWQFVDRARHTVAKVDAGKMRFEDIPSLQDHLQLCRDVAKAADERDQQIQAVRDRYDMDALDDRAEALGDAIAEAEGKVMDTPSPDLAALRWKLERLREPDGEPSPWSAIYVEQTFKDIARLLPEAT